MELLIVLLPLFGAIIAFVFVNLLGTRFVVWSTTILLLIDLGFVCWTFFNIAFITQSTITIHILPWFLLGDCTVNWTFYLDSLVGIMTIVVLTISSLVHLYSIDYMGVDPHVGRFFGYLSLFTFFMLLLVTSGNLAQLFVGWEGVGVCSYLLVGFWFTRTQAVKSALKAMVVNKIGDLGLIGAIALVYYQFGSLDFGCLFALAHSNGNGNVYILGQMGNNSTIIGLFLLIAAIGKSAQLGLHTWLPDAMEGPTPVSALIHAATMVTAGVFLLIKCFPLFCLSSNVLDCIAVVGAMTAVFGATVGLCQSDIKRIVAYSTCSQLGYMVMACGLSAPHGALYHLYTHAFFKALLFLGAGAVIHALADEQDVRRMGGMFKSLPFIYVTLLVGSLTLSGFPFLSGFYSKEFILEWSLNPFSISSIFVRWLGCIAAGLTAFYSFRLIYLTFFGFSTGYKLLNTVAFQHEVPLLMGLVIGFLAFMSVFVGFFSKDWSIGLGSDFFGSAISLSVYRTMSQFEFLPISIKLVPVLLSVVGMICSFLVHSKLGGWWFQFVVSSVGRFMNRLFSNRWFIDSIQNKLVIRPVLWFGYEVAFKFLDRGAIEIFGPVGISRGVQIFVLINNRLMSGYLYYTIFFFLVGIVGLLFLVGVKQGYLSILITLIVLFSRFL